MAVEARATVQGPSLPGAALAICGLIIACQRTTSGRPWSAPGRGVTCTPDRGDQAFRAPRVMSVPADVKELQSTAFPLLTPCLYRRPRGLKAFPECLLGARHLPHQQLRQSPAPPGCAPSGELLSGRDIDAITKNNLMGVGRKWLMREQEYGLSAGGRDSARRG